MIPSIASQLTISGASTRVRYIRRLARIAPPIFACSHHSAIRLRRTLPTITSSITTPPTSTIAAIG